ncbi:MAG: ferredoxin reductase family protein, partial [Candidatus Thermoplasmatota archaeon]|nr:ferredoxin reductase family protein [Candidatus Thermoplasmatota archaeon]
ILLQIMLIGRVKWIETIFGFDKLSRLHHVNGFIIPFLIVIHPMLLVISSSLVSKRDWITSFIRLLNIDNVFNALLGTILFLILVVLAILIVYKKLKYEAWYLTHLAMYAAVLLAFSHEFSGDDMSGWAVAFWYGLYAFVLINLLYYRFFLPIWRSWKHEFKVDRVAEEPGEVTSIYITGKNLDKYKVKAGQFFIFRFLDKERWWQAHPFSLSVAPNGKFLRISAKALGDFTAKMHGIKPGTRIFIDGPHGVFTLDRANKDKYLLVAGGIGITPVRSIAETLAMDKKDAVLLYGSRTERGITFRNEFQEMSNGALNVQYVLSNDAAWQGEKGYIDKEKIQRLAPDFMDREVYLCGPKPMMRGALSAFKQLGVPRHQIHFELFSL